MAYNDNFNLQSQNEDILLNRAPGSAQSFNYPENLFAATSNAHLCVAPSPRVEVNRAPGADRPYSRQRISYSTSSNASERSSPMSELELNLPIQYEQRICTERAPGTNRPLNNAHFGQQNYNFGRNMNESKACEAYNNGALFASSKCQDYNNSFYDRCIDKQRLRITCDHRIIKFSKGVRNVPDSLCIGSTQARSMSSYSPSMVNFEQVAPQMIVNETNAKTSEERKFYEKTTKTLDDYKSTIEQQFNYYAGMEDDMHLMIEREEKKIETYFQNTWELLDRRKKELLYYLYDQRKKYVKVLNDKLREISDCNLRILQLDNLSFAIQNSSNNEEILRTTDVVRRELVNLKNKMDNIVLVKSLVVFFEEPDVNLQYSIALLGSLKCQLFDEISSRIVSIDNFRVGRAIMGLPYMIKLLPPTRPFMFGKDVLTRPWGVCCNRQGYVYVGDRGKNKIMIFNQNGLCTGEIGDIGNGPGEFFRPAGIAIDLLNRLIVADKDNHRVQILTSEGKFITQIGGNGFGSEDSRFHYPWDVAVNIKGDIVVADGRNNRIQLFDKEGQFKGKFCLDKVFPVRKPKTEPTPRGVCFTPTGDILVSDFQNLCIVVVSSDLQTFRVINYEKQFSRLQGIACDDFNNIIVSDSRDNQIKALRINGDHIFTIGRSGKGIGEFDRPSGICLSPGGRILCVDFGNDRVHVI